MSAPNVNESPPACRFDRIGDYLDYYARTAPRSTAVVFAGERIDYADLKCRVDECAMAMYARGIRKGSRVAMLSTPRPEFWIVFLATVRIGAIWVGLNPKYQLGEMQHVVQDSQPTMLFALSDFQGRSYGSDVTELLRVVPSVSTIVGIGDPGGDFLGFDRFLASHESCAESDYRDGYENVEKFDPALIVYTSGTTGRPKGAVLSHHSISAGAQLQTAHLRVENPAIVVNFPINHVACVADCCATTYVKGGKIVFQERFDPRATLAAIEAERCNLFAGVPTMLQMMLMHPDFEDTDLSSIELVAWGGAAMPRDGIVALKKVCSRTMSLYGMTETAAHVIYGEEGASIEQLAESIGKPDPGIGCRIVDETGGPCPPGSSGELQFKADFLMLGYWRNAEATGAVFTDDGWLRTGDLAEWRDDGNIRLVGRLSDMFKSGGYNVYPREIEMTLESVPGVAMAAVVGVPDDLYQEVGHAFVVPDGTADVTEAMLQEVCKQRLANYKIPKKIVVSGDLPLLPVGKIDKKSLAALALDNGQEAR